MRAYLLTIGGEKQEATPYPRGVDMTPKTFLPEQVEDLVGGYYEVINLTEEVVMVVREDEEDQMYNPKATELYNKAVPDEPRVIVGNVLICESGMVE